ncbi:hypothetical protein [Clostridium beijerinckii]|uniref:hypothetical protein n=1 Tax=Clostridium beijerinckii TaxID=1520 RepID=UPI00156E1618|nr:hypothetical protein [Clostridium beijerinckii]NRW69895.1 hypothetical protein [Clostridium beijerinckii]
MLRNIVLMVHILNTIASGLSNPMGIAIDSSDNIIVTDLLQMQRNITLLAH